MSFSNEYHFTTHWRVPGTVDEVMDVLRDPEDLARWWPAVYLEVDELAPGDARGIGKHVSLYTKGWLPYTLRWQFIVTEAHDRGWRIEASGDLSGVGEWTFEQQGDEVEAVYDWRVRADKPLLRFFSPLLRPVFAANHRWAMSAGERSLRIELDRRRATTPEELDALPDPPGPASARLSVLVTAGATAATAAVVAITVGVVRALRGQPRRRRGPLLPQ